MRRLVIDSDGPRMEQDGYGDTRASRDLGAIRCLTDSCEFMSGSIEVTRLRYLEPER